MANDKLIYASDARKAILKADPKLAYVIDNVPAVDAVEVAHGRWEYGKWEQGHWVKGNERCRCSVCHRDFAVDNLNIWHGCPQCLAKMDGEDVNEDRNEERNEAESES